MTIDIQVDYTDFFISKDLQWNIIIENTYI